MSDEAMSDGRSRPTDGASDAARANGMARVPDGVLLQHVADEIILLDLASGTYFGLDPIGSRMLDLMLLHGEVEDVLDALEAEYDASRATLARDLADLADQLREHGLVCQEGAA